jgi:hypothetical protein
MSANTIAAFEQDLAAYAGDSLQFDVDVFTDEAKTQPYDLTAFDEIELQIRVKRTETGTPLVQDDLLGGLQVVNTNKLRVNVSGDKMKALAAKTYEYDVEGRNTSDTKTIMQGKITITGDVVR